MLWQGQLGIEKMNKFNGLFLSACIGTLCAPNVFAQSTGGVFPPVVNEGHKSAQFRTGYDPDSEKFANRLHYQQSLNDDLMWRVVVQSRETEDSDLDFDFVQGELFWQLEDVADNWQTGFRFDARIRGDNRPQLFGANWMNQFSLSEKWTARAVVLSSFDIGDDARDGVFVGTRTSLAYKTDAGPSLGVEFFNSYGSTESLGNFNTQNHQIGPFAVLPVAKDWGVLVGALFGVSDAAQDTNLKLWLTRKF